MGISHLNFLSTKDFHNKRLLFKINQSNKQKHPIQMYLHGHTKLVLLTYTGLQTILFYWNSIGFGWCTFFFVAERFKHILTMFPYFLIWAALACSISRKWKPDWPSESFFSTPTNFHQPYRLLLHFSMVCCASFVNWSSV